MLLRNGFPDGAYYIAGYAAECAIKACISRSTDRHEFPDKKRALASHTHNLGELIGVAELKTELTSAEKTDPKFSQYWGIVRDWSEQSRYERLTVQQAEALINALRDGKHGVMRWLKQYW